MWVYSGESLEHRLKLDPLLGFWIDYWLFLHGDEAHPIWCNRPLGLRAIAITALESQSSTHNRLLRKQLKLETSLVTKLIAYLKCVPPHPVITLDFDNSVWPENWLRWFEQIAKVEASILANEIIEAITMTLGSKDLFTTAYLTRRLAAELGGDEWSKGQLFTVAQSEICDSGLFDSQPLDVTKMAESLRNIFVTTSPSSYTVTVNVAPAAISSQLAKTSVSVLASIDENGLYTLTGLKSEVKASHPHLAAMKGLNSFGKTLEYLRLRHNVRTHLYGAIKVSCSAQEIETSLSLPQPFWPNERGRRKIPRLPSNFNRFVNNLSSNERNKWYAARWHLSSAFSDWSEDIHSAAAKVWQAIESFSSTGSATNAVSQITESYLRIMPTKIATFLAHRIEGQRVILSKRGYHPKWYRFNESNTSIETWLWRILDKRSYKHYSSWVSPPAPEAAFNPQVGLLQTIYRRMNNPNSEAWMERRVEGDLKLLYGLRNAVVHNGTRIFAVRMADYLARVGTEVLLELIEDAIDTALPPKEKATTQPA
jgi:hypothetical protein